MTTRPKFNPFTGMVKMPTKSMDQTRRDAADEMRATQTGQTKPSSRVPLHAQSKKSQSQTIASAIVGGSPKDKAAYAQEKSKRAAGKLLTTPAKRGK